MCPGRVCIISLVQTTTVWVWFRSGHFTALSPSFPPLSALTCVYQCQFISPKNNLKRKNPRKHTKIHKKLLVAILRLILSACSGRRRQQKKMASFRELYYITSGFDYVRLLEQKKFYAITQVLTEQSIDQQLKNYWMYFNKIRTENGENRELAKEEPIQFCCGSGLRTFGPWQRIEVSGCIGQ